MKLSICTISFRHHLTSIDQLAQWASTHHFDGIELWGIHATNLANTPQFNAAWIERLGLGVSMLSDYLPMEGPEAVMLAKAQSLCALAEHWNTQKIRTFAGHRSSTDTSPAERRQIVSRLRQLCELLAEHDQQLLIETHPNTLADSLASTMRLLAEVNHPGLRINFDVLHVWESGEDPLEALALMRPFVSHYHLKNIGSREQLGVFAPPNVYAAAGSREGMVPLFRGAVDYYDFLCHLLLDEASEASLEWFGGDAEAVLKQDCTEIRQLERALQRELTPSRMVMSG
ncbi:sugar phosphate isomerase/epimerase family protein [Allohahella marinimesophila]|uniref:Petrobactin biosynthesis 3-dehydroshikimate dehydratase AsbF n=1 Tax=Allohahella marinimesophila TaxID=1054972 RepID=A0ABP7NWZ9_9GAMM